MEIFDRLAPLTYVRIKKPPMPWLIAAVRAMIRGKNRALRRYRSTRSLDDWLCYKKIRNEIATTIRREKRSFISFSSRNQTSQNFWNDLTSLGDRSCTNTNIPDHILDADLLNNISLTLFQLLPI